MSDQSKTAEKEKSERDRDAKRDPDRDLDKLPKTKRPQDGEPVVRQG